MKRMKAKRFLSLLLALVMSLSLSAPAFAADVANATFKAGLKPPLQLYPKEPISMSSGNSVGPFTTSPNAGAYLQVWFANRGTADVTVILMDGTNRIPLSSMTVAQNGAYHDDAFVYHIPSSDVPNTFYIYFQARNSARILGDVSVALYAYDPSDLSAAGPDAPGGRIMPKSVTLYENPTICDQAKSNYTTNRFTSTPGSGQYVKVSFRNDSVQTAAVKLYRTDSTLPAVTFTVGAGETGQILYTGSDTAPISYYVNVDIQNNYSVQGCLTVVQKNIMS